jgi:hypothetical protein
VSLPPLKIYVKNPPPKEEWSSSGIAGKPKACEFCPCHTTQTGFVPDYFPPEAKVLFVLSAPRPDDAEEQLPLSGGMGKWLMREFVYKLGHKKEDVAITHILRCAPRITQKGIEYPTGPKRGKAENMCRQYDDKQGVEGQLVPGGVKKFNPNVFMLTFELTSVKYGPAFQHLLKESVRKCFRLAEKGYRPALVCGKEAGELFFPYAFSQGQGGTKSWINHYMVSDWGGLEIKKEETLKGFSLQ